MKGSKAAKFVAELQPLLRKTSGLPADIEPSMYDANIYEIVSMYIAAARQDGLTGKPQELEAERTKIRDYLANLHGFEGFSGPTQFSADGDAVKTFFIVQGQNGAWATKESGCSAEGAC
jgi:branched-chain amino acid transport system substrate-binding protein